MVTSRWITSLSLIATFLSSLAVHAGDKSPACYEVSKGDAKKISKLIQGKPKIFLVDWQQGDLWLSQFCKDCKVDPEVWSIGAGQVTSLMDYWGTAKHDVKIVQDEKTKLFSIEFKGKALDLNRTYLNEFALGGGGTYGRALQLSSFARSACPAEGDLLESINTRNIISAQNFDQGEKRKVDAMLPNDQVKATYESCLVDLVGQVSDEIKDRLNEMGLTMNLSRLDSQPKNVTHVSGGTEGEYDDLQQRHNQFIEVSNAQGAARLVVTHDTGLRETSEKVTLPAVPAKLDSLGRVLEPAIPEREATHLTLKVIMYGAPAPISNVENPQVPLANLNLRPYVCQKELTY